MKTRILLTTSFLLAAYSPGHITPQDTPVAPPTIGFESNNPIATEHLSTALSRTGKVTCAVNNQEYTLTNENAELPSFVIFSGKVTSCKVIQYWKEALPMVVSWVGNWICLRDSACLNAILPIVISELGKVSVFKPVQ